VAVNNIGIIVCPITQNIAADKNLVPKKRVLLFKTTVLVNSVDVPLVCCRGITRNILRLISERALKKVPVGEYSKVNIIK
jgi:hypothetical protein